MSTAASVNERLERLTRLGTSVWLDQIRRSLVDTGELARMVREESLRGVTSNPAIFEKAILGSPEYDEQLEKLAREGADTRSIYQAIAIRDVQEACDVLRPVWDETKGHDGYVSLEVDPDLAFDTARTMEQAREYWGRVGRPNLMIKIPGTDEGLPAIEQMLYEGLNINVTLLFKVEQYAKVCDAFLAGMGRRLEEGKSLDVHSVASFFVSRVDTEVDQRLEGLGRTDLRGRAGLANARHAYQVFEEVFGGERFAALREAGCAVQRPLWASTGVKNPEYPETLYVDGLAGPETVNTMPMATINAAAEHSEVTEPTVTIDPTDDLRALADAGIDMTDVTDKLLRDGVAAFVTPMEKLLAGIESKREAIVTGRPPTIEASLPAEVEPAVAARVRRAADEEVVRRIWHKDDTLWGPAGQAEVADRLGWLSIADKLLDCVEDLEALRANAQADGLTDAVVLGMGGSSLAPEVFARSFTGAGGLRLHVLDSTDAGAVRDVQEAIDLDKALFVVSSKSGGTIETLSAFHHFWEATGGDGSRFVAVTDPGTSLQDLARERGFRRVFCNDPEIGGRYSALSYFGLVPAALLGADVRALLEGAQVAQESCDNLESSQNSGLWLGCAVGELALRGRDKLTFLVDEPIASFGLWVEQLVAESLGKHGKGVLPVADEPLGDPSSYGEDRVFVHLRSSDDHAPDVGDHPLITLRVDGAADLGRVMFFAEFATAVAGRVLEINPFDQPNVQAAKDKTKEVLGAGEPPAIDEADEAALRALLDAGPPSYLAIQGWVAPSAAFDAAIADLRAAIRDRTRLTTTFGYGPRYLHSTGQLHKGGPATGRFLQLLHEAEPDRPVPGEAYSFETLKKAQADGDLLVLREHGLPAERVVLRGDPVEALARLKEIL
ncbi:MAG: bifunctional transaldolase/phosoglucose isomerase [Solirubrobacterales bacterium]|nr:bifunctional transaldolase/phosoglucose isomerase [Solirubrobacterales bacterium]